MDNNTTEAITMTTIEEDLATLPVGPRRVKLSIPILSAYLVRDLPIREIARRLGYSHVWVLTYIKKNFEAFAPLIDKTDTITSMKFKQIADLCQDKLIEHIPKANEKDIQKLGIISGIATDKYRLSSDKSTANISTKNSINEDRSVIERELKDVQVKIAALKGEAVDV